MAKEIVISTSRLNCYGFRVLTKGIDTSQYKRNPILLWNHNRPWRGTEDEVLPIGRMENLRVDGDRLIGTPVFDTSDEFARRIADKFGAGFLRMASAGLNIVETSTDEAMLLPGQSRPTAVKSKLVEVSIVDIGANDDAVALYRDGRDVTLAAGGDSQDVDLILPEIALKTQLNNKKMSTETTPTSPDTGVKIIALKLGLQSGATEAEVLAAIGALQGEAAAAAQLRKAAAEQLEKSIASEVDAALRANRITADKREHFIKLGKSAGLDELRITLECISPAVKPTSLLAHGGAAPAPGKSGKAYAKLSEVPAEERVELRKSNVEEYKRLYKAEYGIDAEIK